MNIYWTTAITLLLLISSCSQKNMTIESPTEQVEWDTLASGNWGFLAVNMPTCKRIDGNDCPGFSYRYQGLESNGYICNIEGTLHKVAGPGCKSRIWLAPHLNNGDTVFDRLGHRMISFGRIENIYYSLESFPNASDEDKLPSNILWAYMIDSLFPIGMAEVQISSCGVTRISSPSDSTFFGKIVLNKLVKNQSLVVGAVTPSLDRFAIIVRPDWLLKSWKSGSRDTLLYNLKSNITIPSNPNVASCLTFEGDLIQLSIGKEQYVFNQSLQQIRKNNHATEGVH